MSLPTVQGLVVTFPAKSYFSHPIQNQVGATLINGGLQRSVTLSPCTEGTETLEIPWKGLKNPTQSPAFIQCDPLSWVQRTAIGETVIVRNGQRVPAADVGVHPRGMIYSKVPVPDSLTRVRASFSYKRERYDLIEITSAGQLNVVPGYEDDFAASEFLPVPTPGSLSLYHAYVWNDQVELIDAHSWTGTRPNDPIKQARINAIRRHNQRALPRMAEALKAKQPVRIAGYGDSITAIGGAWSQGGEDLLSMPGGPLRDTSSFVYWHTPALRAKYPDLGLFYPQNNKQYNRVTWGWGHHLVEAIRIVYGVSASWSNWGVGGSTSVAGDSGPGDASIPPPGDDHRRLAPLLASEYDLALLNFQMNDFVGFAMSDLYGPLTALVRKLKAARPQSDVVLMGAPGINAENPNELDWLARADDIYREVAVAENCGYVPTYLVTHGDPGFLKISRHHYAGANRYNHPMPYELSKLSDWLFVALGL